MIDYIKILSAKFILVRKGFKRHILSPEIFEESGFDWDDVKTSKFIIRVIPQGKALKSKIKNASNDFLTNKRFFMSKTYIKGTGIEIGALHNPLEVAKEATVKYVDYKSLEDLYKHYPELKNQKITEPDIVDDGEELSSINDESQDFVIANHFLEHCRNPIKAIKNMLRVLRKDGFAYIAIPDKRFTFDCDRECTPIEHLIRDFEEGPEWSQKEHYMDWLENKAKLTDKELIQKKVQEHISKDLDIHFHVWTQADMLQLFGTLKHQFSLQFEIELCIQNLNGFETIFILKKT